MSFFKCSSDSYSASSAGGRYQKWNILDNLKQRFKEHKKGFCMEVKESYDLRKKFENENPRIIDPAKYESQEELFSAVKKHWVDRLENKESTIDKRIARATNIAKHPVFPINFFDLNPNQIDAYIQFRKHNENATSDAIRNDLKTIYTFARAYGIQYSSWNIVYPKKQAPKKKIIPKVSDVYKLIHSKYSSDRYENALYQYLMYFSFLIGMRCPSELYSLKTSDIYLDDGILVIHEDKKYGQDRQIIPESVIINGKTRKSFKNWLDHWRPKAVSQYSKDFLFLKSDDGKPFTKEGLRYVLSKKGKQVCNTYSPKKARDWCAIARLIKTKLETGNYGIYEIRDWLGHDNVTTTQAYTYYADQYFRRDPYDWIRAILKYKCHLAQVEEKSTESKLLVDNTVLNDSVSVNYSESPQVRFSSLLLIQSKLFTFFRVLIFRFHLIKTLGVLF